jgi:predicted ABC-type ATPase
MPNLYIISGCNGAGKTTASFTILPEMLNCKEFVNADSIAAGLSPFNPESVAIEAGRIMLMRISELLRTGEDFAFETTLATRSYLSLIKKAHTLGYKVTLLFIWLDSPKTALQRVARRVAKGGHNIPKDVIERRYYRGISNLVTLFIPVVDIWMIVNSTNVVIEPISEGGFGVGSIISNDYIWGVIFDQSHAHGDK